MNNKLSKSNKNMFTLQDLWNFDDQEITKILKDNKIPTSDSLHNVFNLIQLYQNNIQDQQYIKSPYFKELFLTNDDELLITATERGFTDQDYDHISLIKYIIDNIIPIVATIPATITDDLELYQIKNDIYVCGKGTFKIKDQLKSLKGKWVPNLKCWSLSSTYKDELINLIYIPTNVQIPNKVQIHNDIPIIDTIPNIIPNDLRIYQFNNEIIICGKKTYSIKDDLRKLNSKFNSTYKCWIIPNEHIDDAINIINKANDEIVIEKQRVNEQRQITRRKNLNEKQQQQDLENARQERLLIPEHEATFIPHINRISQSILDAAYPDLSDDDLDHEMQLKDIAELEPLWADKIKLVEHVKGGRGSTIIVTYEGNIKPPDIAFEYFMNNWRPIRLVPGYSVRKINYKTYEVHRFTTD